MWHPPFPWPDTTNLFLGKGDKDILIDLEAYGEVRSKTRKIRFCQQHDYGFACVRSRRTPCGDLFGVIGAIFRPLSEAQPLKMARPPHNSGSTATRLEDHY